MTSKNERMEKLNCAGINTSKYFNLDLPNGLKPGAKIQLVIAENGDPVIVSEDIIPTSDHIAHQIIADGYVRNTKLHRRFVMAQMFHMLNYVSYDRSESGFSACLKNMYGYNYTLTMMLEEIRVLSKLQNRDQESFEERGRFFTKAVIVNVLEDYVDKLAKYVDSLPDRNCKGVPYKRIKGQNIFNDDLDRKLYAPLKRKIGFIRSTSSYSAIYSYMQDFMRDMIKLPYDTPKSKVWIDAYKGEGAYYTLKNLIMFHNCGIVIGRDAGYAYKLDTQDSMQELERKLVEYHGEGWRMFALMKKVIEDNNFNFDARMEELGVY